MSVLQPGGEAGVTLDFRVADCYIIQKYLLSLTGVREKGYAMVFRSTAFIVLSMFIFVSRSALSSVLSFPGYQATLAAEDQSGISLNKHTNLLVTLIPTEGTKPEVLDFKFDARMPQHKHGMVTSAKVSKIGDLQYRVEGVRLHMPGFWLFEFTIVDKSGETKISSPFELKP